MPARSEPRSVRLLIERVPVTEREIAEFVALALSQDALHSMRVFDTAQADFVAGNVPDADARLQRYIDMSGALRRLARAVVQRGNELRDAGDLVAARRHYNAVLVAADANSWEGVALVGQLTADAMRRAAEAELAKLPAE